MAARATAHAVMMGHSATCRTVRAMAAFAPTADIACAGFMSTRPNKTNGAWSAFRLGLNCCYRNFPDLPAGPRRIHGRRGNESPRAPQRTRPRHAPEMALTVKKSCAARRANARIQFIVSSVIGDFSNQVGFATRPYRRNRRRSRTGGARFASVRFVTGQERPASF